MQNLNYYFKTILLFKILNKVAVFSLEEKNPVDCSLLQMFLIVIRNKTATVRKTFSKRPCMKGENTHMAILPSSLPHSHDFPSIFPYFLSEPF